MYECPHTVAACIGRTASCLAARAALRTRAASHQREMGALAANFDDGGAQIAAHCSAPLVAFSAGYAPFGDD
jgi:hypothetical protein